MSSKKRILILIPPASGHMNPVCCIVSELAKYENLHIAFFGNQKYKALIEKTGAEYKHYSNFDLDDPKFFESDPDKNNQFSAIKTLLTMASNLLPELASFCDEFKPHVIMHDNIALHAKFLINYLESKSKKNKLNYAMPKLLNIFSCFAFLKGVYPNNEELNLLLGPVNKIDALISGIKIFRMQRKINKEHGINFKLNPKFMLSPCSYLNICTTFQELQPRADKMTHLVKFIGCCIEEEVRNISKIDEKLKNLLAQYDPINPVEIIQNREIHNNRKLIYASLGTISIINKNSIVYEKIIEAFKIFDQENPSDNSIKLNQLDIVISLGQISFEKIHEKISKENYKVPDNILLLPSVPQLEILKRASLFITHAGMNSTSEAIHYGVPVICLPVQVDQPLVAQRICDELKFGERLNFNTFTPNELRKSIYQVLSNETYLANILEFSKISRKYNGNIDGAKLIYDYVMN